MQSAPVLVLFFNRPDSLSSVLQKVLAASPRSVYLACDGPRHDQDRDLVEACRRLATGLRWQCPIQTRFLDFNAGCAHACSDAITWFFSHEPSGIVLEDDCLPDPTFFPFATELLDRYADRPEVLSISGSCFDLREESRRSTWSYRFSRLPFVWGWASWARSWSGYRLTLDRKADCRIEPNRLPVDTRPSSRGWRRRLGRVAGPSPSTWDYQWTWRHLSTGGLSIIPRTNLVRNIFSSSGTNMRRVGVWQNLPTQAIPLPLTHPEAISPDPELDRHLDTVVYNHRPWAMRKAWQIAIRHDLVHIDAIRLGRWMRR